MQLTINFSPFRIQTAVTEYGLQSNMIQDGSPSYDLGVYDLTSQCFMLQIILLMKKSWHN